MGTAEHQEMLPAMHVTLVTSLDFNHKQIKQPSCPGVNQPRDEGNVCFPSFRGRQSGIFPQLTVGYLHLNWFSLIIEIS